MVLGVWCVSTRLNVVSQNLLVHVYAQTHCHTLSHTNTLSHTVTHKHTVTHCHTQTRSVVALQTVRCKRVAAGAYHSVFITGKQLHVNAIHSLIELSNSLGIYNTKKLLTSLITLLL